MSKLLRQGSTSRNTPTSCSLSLAGCIAGEDDVVDEDGCGGGNGGVREETTPARSQEIRRPTFQGRRRHFRDCILEGVRGARDLPEHTPAVDDELDNRRRRGFQSPLPGRTIHQFSGPTRFMNVETLPRIRRACAGSDVSTVDT